MRIDYITEMPGNSRDDKYVRTFQYLDRTLLIEWLLRERLPYFYNSELYREYLLCKELLSVKTRLTVSSHQIDYGG